MRAFVVYTTASGLVKSFHATQAAADAVANADATLTANMGDVAIDQACQPGRCWFDSSDDSFSLEKQTLSVAILARAAHEGRIAVREIGRRIGAGFAPEIAVKFESFIYWTAPFGYLVAHSDTLTLAQKLAWFPEMLKGPADIRVVAGDFEDAVFRFYLKAQNDSTLVAPTVPKAWVNPADGTAVNLADSVTIAGTVPDNINFADGSWIDDLTI